MLMARSTIARIISSIENENKFIKISLRAIAHQEKYNQIAQVASSQNCSDGTSSSILDVMNKQVVYSFVAHMVGNHKDVTKKIFQRNLSNVRLFCIGRTDPRNLFTTPLCLLWVGAAKVLVNSR
jgi:3-oxoacyl-[acyl-carrier-protein] synthase III